MINYDILMKTDGLLTRGLLKLNIQNKPLVLKVTVLN
jgi:hypothetical protein